MTNENLKAATPLKAETVSYSTSPKIIAAVVCVGLTALNVLLSLIPKQLVQMTSAAEMIRFPLSLPSNLAYKILNLQHYNSLSPAPLLLDGLFFFALSYAAIRLGRRNRLRDTETLLRLLLGSLASAGLVVCLLFAAVVGFSLGKSILDTDRFNSTAWKDSTQVYAREAVWFFVRDPVRIRMIDDLVTNHDLTGLSRDSVITLLGEPPHTAYFRDWDLVYWLGPERGFISIDSEWLVIGFDNTNKVAIYQVVRD